MDTIKKQEKYTVLSLVMIHSPKEGCYTVVKIENNNVSHAFFSGEGAGKNACDYWNSYSKLEIK